MWRDCFSAFNTSISKICLVFVISRIACTSYPVCLLQFVLNEVLHADEIRNELENLTFNDKLQAKLNEFIEKIADVSWFMEISYPKMILNFSVEGQQYKGKHDKKFHNYATDTDVVDAEKAIGTIIVVAWPSLELEPDRGILNLGEVVTVSKIDIKA